ncbi:MAG: hypothetical protein RBT86_05485, partial [Azospira sp.]|nr:hypothetical protein [Azospira sp.]
MQPLAERRTPLETAKGCLAAFILVGNVLTIFTSMMPFALAKLCLPFPAARRPLDRNLNRQAETWI